MRNNNNGAWKDIMFARFEADGKDLIHELKRFLISGNNIETLEFIIFVGIMHFWYIEIAKNVRRSDHGCHYL